MSRHEITFDAAFPIDMLVPGHQHPLYPANPRKGGHETSLPELKQSIRDQGVLQPLRIFTDGLAKDGKYWVHVGERRLLASQENMADHPDAWKTVPVIIVDGITPQEAFQESLTEQVNRLPLHPIDQFEAFAGLIKGGMDEAQIASHYGIDKRVVRQRIALGRIAPKILKAWRGEAINEDCAREFTRLSSHKEQEALFERQRKANALNARAVRAVLVPDHGDGARLVEFVGLDAYRARGGEIHEDLFNGVHAVSDSALAASMAREKLEAEVLRLTSMEGWGWAALEADMPQIWRNYPRSEAKMDMTPDEKARRGQLDALIEDPDVRGEQYEDAVEEAERIEAAARFRAFTDRQKKKSGCVLSIDRKGRLSIEAGVIKPDEAKADPAPAPVPGKKEAPAKAKDGDKAEPEKAPSLSGAQASELAVTLTEAMELTVAGNFNLAMSLALATFATRYGNTPVCLSANGSGSDALKLTDSDDFTANLALMLKLKPQQREVLFAKVVGAALRFAAPSAERHAMTDDGVAAIVNAGDPKVTLAMIRKRFDPDAYFDRAPKAMALKAITEVFGKHDFADSAPKAEVVEFAKNNVPPAQWLPEEVRAAGYDGPGAKKKSAAKASAKSAAKGKAPAKKKAKR